MASLEKSFTGTGSSITYGSVVSSYRDISIMGWRIDYLVIALGLIIADFIVCSRLVGKERFLLSRRIAVIYWIVISAFIIFDVLCLFFILKEESIFTIASLIVIALYLIKNIILFIRKCEIVK